MTCWVGDKQPIWRVPGAKMHSTHWNSSQRWKQAQGPGKGTEGHGDRQAAELLARGLEVSGEGRSPICAQPRRIPALATCARGLLSHVPRSPQPTALRERARGSLPAQEGSQLPTWSHRARGLGGHLQGLLGEGS